MVKRTFPPEFKQHCCRAVINDKRPMTEVYKSHNLDRQTLHRWVKEYKELGDNAFVDRSLVTREAQIEKLKREKRELEEANEILKKAVAYLTKKRND